MNERLYRITLVGNAWHVLRPQACLAHAFADLRGAEAFVLNDSGSEGAVIEILAGATYMVKSLQARR